MSLFAIVLSLAVSAAPTTHHGHGGHHAVTLVVGQTEPLNLPYKPTSMSCDNDVVLGVALDHDEVVATGKSIGRATCRFVAPAPDPADDIRFVVVGKDAG